MNGEHEKFDLSSKKNSLKIKFNLQIHTHYLMYICVHTKQQ